MDILNDYAAVKEGSDVVTGWALAVVGGTVAAIIGGSYLHPTKSWRLIYILYIPGWFGMGMSVYFGQMVSRRIMALHLVTSEEVVDDIEKGINNDLSLQMFWFEVGMAFFSLWLLLFLIWWVFFYEYEER